MQSLNLPEEVVASFMACEQLQYDANTVTPGLVELTPLMELTTGGVQVTTHGTALASDDPHAGEDGYYEVPAVSLTKPSEKHDAGFLLLWLPGERLFGTWARERRNLFVFRNATWKNIVAEPAKYINAQWSADPEEMEHFIPYPQYEFTTGTATTSDNGRSDKEPL